MHRMGMNPCASESPRPELSHAQGFISKSLTVASECSTENPSFSEFRIFSPKFTSFSCMKMCTQFCGNEQIMIIYLCRSRRFADISHCVVASAKHLGATVKHRCSKPCVWEKEIPHKLGSLIKNQTQFKNQNKKKFGTLGMFMKIPSMQKVFH